MMILNKLSSFSNSDTSHSFLISEKLIFEFLRVEDITTLLNSSAMLRKYPLFNCVGTEDMIN
jgi:hypothetical protein